MKPGKYKYRLNQDDDWVVVEVFAIPDGTLFVRREDSAYQPCVEGLPGEWVKL